MRDSVSEIVKLCESWWARRDATTLEQRGVIKKLLALLDWDLPIPFTPKPGAEKLGALTYLLRGEGPNTIAAYFLAPGILEPPSFVMDRGLDFCVATKVLLEESRASNIGYVFVSDLFRSYLYDARTDDLLLYADDVACFNRELSETLNRGSVAHGSLDDVRREPRSVMARRLREWRERWKRSLGEYNAVSESLLDVLMDRLFILRFLFQHDILRKTRRQLEARFHALTADATAQSGAAGNSCGRELVKLFHDMWLDWKSETFAPVPELDALLENTALAAPLLRELAMLSHVKFSIATALESFNYGDPTEKLRVRMVPDENEEREYYLGKQTLATIDSAQIEVDINEEGYRAIFGWFDRLIAVYERLDQDFEVQARREIPHRQDVDLFAWSELDSRRPAACADRIAHACAHGFRIAYKSEQQHRVARLLFMLHVIASCHRRQQTMERLPALGRIFRRQETPGARGRTAQAPPRTADASSES